MITQEYVDELERDAKKFLEEFEAMDPEDAKQYALDMLDRMGVLDENKQPKEQIVTGDFFGW
ncbi:MAG: hypothetical protein IKI75_05650 [Lachnospiraceae bacterium]|nr:hypothetical protein [Lachnospiraceae bacterium]